MPGLNKIKINLFHRLDTTKVREKKQLLKEKFFHLGTCQDMVYSRSCIKVYTIMYPALTGVVWVFYIMGLLAFFFFEIVVYIVNILI